jgi:Tol biopolymer transport system component
MALTVPKEGTNVERMEEEFFAAMTSTAVYQVQRSVSAGQELLVASFRTGDTEIFIVDPDTGDARNLTRSPESKERYPSWSNVVQLTKLGKACTTPAVSPDGKWISFRYCDEIYWRDGKTSARAYRARRADKRPVWVMGRDGSNPHVIEALHYQTTIDGSRAPLETKINDRIRRL